MIKLIKSTFYKESDTKEKLSKFIMSSEKLSIGEQCKKFEKILPYTKVENIAYLLIAEALPTLL